MKRQAKEEAYILEICRMAAWMRDQRVNQAWRWQVRQWEEMGESGAGGRKANLMFPVSSVKCESGNGRGHRWGTLPLGEICCRGWELEDSESKVSQEWARRHAGETMGRTDWLDRKHILESFSRNILNGAGRIRLERAWYQGEAVLEWHVENGFQEGQLGRDELPGLGQW